jgi:hypothetical protein
MKNTLDKSFIVRIYEIHTKGISGIVECAETSSRKSFHNIDELWSLVTSDRNSRHDNPEGNVVTKLNFNN